MDLTNGFFSHVFTPHFQELRPHGATLQRRSPRAIEDGKYQSSPAVKMTRFSNKPEPWLNPS